MRLGAPIGHKWRSGFQYLAHRTLVRASAQRAQLQRARVPRPRATCPSRGKRQVPLVDEPLGRALHSPPRGHRCQESPGCHVRKEQCDDERPRDTRCRVLQPLAARARRRRREPSRIARIGRLLSLPATTPFDACRSRCRRWRGGLRPTRGRKTRHARVDTTARAATRWPRNTRGRRIAAGYLA